MLGLALGGGGAKGTAHLGILAQLEKNGIRPDCISGTSAGAAVAALYAYGIPLDEISKILRTLRAVSFASFKMNSLGLFENLDLENALARTIGRDSKIEDCKIPLAIQVTNIETGEGKILTKGNLLKAVIASCCIPAIYVPQEIDGCLYVDGGLTENVPVRAAKKLGADMVIGIDLNGQTSYKKPHSIMDVVTNSFDLLIDMRTKEQLLNCDYVISLDLTKYSRTSADDFDALYIEGEKHALDFISSGSKISALRFKYKLSKLWRKLFHR